MRSALTKRAHFAIAGLAFAGVSVAARFVTLTNADAPRYEQLARNLLRGHFSACAREPFLPEFERMPGYPAFLALVHAVGGSGAYPVSVAQGLVHACTVLLVYHLARTLTERQTVALLACALWAFDPFAVYYSIQTLSECLAAFLTTALLAALAGYVHRSRRWMLALSALAGVSAAFVRPNLLLLPVGICAITMLKRSPHRRRMLMSTLLVVAVTVIAFIPWTARNYAAFHRPIIGAHQYLGMNLCESAVQFQMSPQQMEEYCFRDLGINTLTECDYQKSLAADQIMIARAREHVASAPIQTALLAFVRPVRLWFSFYVTDVAGEKARVLETGMRIYTLGMLGFFVLGVYLLWRRTEPGYLVGASCLSLSAMHIVLVVSARYAMPVRPLYMIAVACAMETIVRNRRRILARLFRRDHVARGATDAESSS